MVYFIGLRFNGSTSTIITAYISISPNFFPRRLYQFMFSETAHETTLDMASFKKIKYRYCLKKIASLIPITFIFTFAYFIKFTLIFVIIIFYNYKI